MADVVRELKIRISADDVGAAKVFKDIGRDAQQLAREVGKPMYAHLEVDEASRFALPAQIRDMRENAERELAKLRTESITRQTLLFDADYHQQQVKETADRMIAAAQDEVDRKQIELRSRDVAREARDAARQERPDLIPPEPKERFRRMVDRDGDERELRRQRAEMLEDIRRESRRETAAVALRQDIAGPLTEKEFTREQRDRFRATAPPPGPVPRSALEDLHNAFGRGSRFNELAEIAVGGGVLIGLTRAADLVKQASEGVQRLGDDLRNDDVSAGKMADSFARSLPILGQLFTAGRNIREAFTGEEDSLRRANEEAAELTKTIDLQRHMWADVVKATEESERNVAAMQRQSLRIGPTGAAAVDVARETGALDRREAIQQRYRDLAEQKDKESLARILELRGKANTAAAFEINPYKEALKQSLQVIPGADLVSDADSTVKEQAARDAEAKRARGQASSVERSAGLALKQLAVDQGKELIAADALAQRERLDQAIRQTSDRVQLLSAMERDAAQTIARSGIDVTRSQGFGRRADLAAVEQDRVERKRQIAEETQKQVEQDPANRNPIEQKGYERQIAADIAAGRQREQINKQYQEQFSADVYRHQQDIADIESKARSERLQAMGNDFEAQAEERRRAFDHERADIEHNRDEQIRHDREHTADFKRQAQEHIAAAEKEFNARERLVRREEASKELEFRTPPFSDAGLTTGAGQAAKEQSLIDLGKFASKEADIADAEQWRKQREHDREGIDRLTADTSVGRLPPEFTSAAASSRFGPDDFRSSSLSSLLADTRMPIGISPAPDTKDKSADETAKNTADTNKRLDALEKAIKSLPKDFAAAMKSNGLTITKLQV